MKRMGFTLIELLAVIAIISVLAALLVPVAGRARAQGESAACVSLLKQLGAANAVYQGDHEGRSVPFATGEVFPQYNVDIWGGRWMHLLEPYTKTYRVFNCPTGDKSDWRATVVDRDTVHRTEGWIIQRGRSAMGVTANYSYSSFIGGRERGSKNPTDTTKSRALVESIVATNHLGIPASRMMVFADGRYWITDSEGGPYTGGSWDYKLLLTDRLRHADKLNASFLDGHVEGLAMTDLRMVPWPDKAICAKK